MTAPVQVGPSSSHDGPGPVPDWNEEMADIGDRIRAERLSRGWSQAELGRRAGLHWETVRRLESGVGWLRCFAQVCWGLGVPMARLLSDEWRLPEEVPSLTPRQVEVLCAAAEGGPLSVVGARLGVSGPAVGSHLSRIYRQLDVLGLPPADRRAAAMRVAIQHHLFDPQKRTS